MPPRAGALVLIALALWSCSPKAPPGSERYVQSVEAARKTKDAMLAGAPDSPVPRDKRSAFLPLAYYAVDPAYEVPASFEEAPPGTRPQMEMQTSTGQPRRMERVGILRFTFQGRRLQLSAFREAGEPPDRLFVPFADQTTGQETYKAGRYLEIPRTSTGIYTVDFNKAFNPYCYYNPTYDCPFPPRENRLPIAIRAGERVK